MTGIIPFNEAAVADPNTQVASLDGTAVATGGGFYANFDVRMTTRSFHISSSDEELEKFASAVFAEVVILDYMPDVGRMFYPKAYDATAKSSDQKPVCWSDDGVTPNRDVTQPQASACESCPMKAAKGEQTEGRATCRYTYQMAVMPIANPKPVACGIQLPAKSTFEEISQIPLSTTLPNYPGQPEFADPHGLDRNMIVSSGGALPYLRHLASKGIAPHTVITRMYINPASEQKQVLFVPIGMIPTDSPINGFIMQAFNEAKDKGQIDALKTLSIKQVSKAKDPALNASTPVAGGLADQAAVTQDPALVAGQAAADAAATQAAAQAAQITQNPENRVDPAVAAAEAAAEAAAQQAAATQPDPAVTPVSQPDPAAEAAAQQAAAQQAAAQQAAATQPDPAAEAAAQQAAAMAAANAAATQPDPTVTPVAQSDPAAEAAAAAATVQPTAPATGSMQEALQAALANAKPTT